MSERISRPNRREFLKIFPVAASALALSACSSSSHLDIKKLKIEKLKIIARNFADVIELKNNKNQLVLVFNKENLRDPEKLERFKKALKIIMSYLKEVGLEHQIDVQNVTEGELANLIGTEQINEVQKAIQRDKKLELESIKIPIAISTLNAIAVYNASAMMMNVDDLKKELVKQKMRYSSDVCLHGQNSLKANNTKQKILDLKGQITRKRAVSAFLACATFVGVASAIKSHTGKIYASDIIISIR